MKQNQAIVLQFPDGHKVEARFLRYYEDSAMGDCEGNKFIQVEVEGKPQLFLEKLVEVRECS